MCGLAAFIGKSKDANKTRELITELFDKTQVRGTDASGFYCVSDQNKVLFKKQPGPSTNLINTQDYRDIWNHDIVSGIFHCRAASVGIGEPANNINNHPFVSDDLSKAVIHNGLIHANEYEKLQKTYKTQSKCDSEILLRFLETYTSTIDGLSKLFSSTINSFFAFIYSINDTSTNKLYLTRNRYRPLYFLDLKEELGQVFVFSTLEILTNCIWNLKLRGFVYKDLSNIYCLNPYDIVLLSYNTQSGLTKSIMKAEQEDYYSSCENLLKQINAAGRSIRKLKFSLQDHRASINNVNKCKVNLLVEEIKNNINSIKFDFT